MTTGIWRDFLKRPRVDSLLKSAIQKPLTTVVAGAGYGKTQAVLCLQLCPLLLCNKHNRSCFYVLPKENDEEDYG